MQIRIIANARALATALKRWLTKGDVSLGHLDERSAIQAEAGIDTGNQSNVTVYHPLLHILDRVLRGSRRCTARDSCIGTSADPTVNTIKPRESPAVEDIHLALASSGKVNLDARGFWRASA